MFGLLSELNLFFSIQVTKICEFAKFCFWPENKFLFSFMRVVANSKCHWGLKKLDWPPWIKENCQTKKVANYFYRIFAIKYWFECLSKITLANKNFYWSSQDHHKIQCHYSHLFAKAFIAFGVMCDATLQQLLFFA